MRWLWKNGYLPYAALISWLTWLVYTGYLVVPQLQTIQVSQTVHGRTASLSNAQLFELQKYQRRTNQSGTEIPAWSLAIIGISQPWNLLRKMGNRCAFNYQLLLGCADYAPGVVVPIVYHPANPYNARMNTPKALWSFLPSNLLALGWFGGNHPTDFSSEGIARINRGKLMLDSQAYEAAIYEFTVLEGFIFL